MDSSFKIIQLSRPAAEAAGRSPLHMFPWRGVFYFRRRALLWSYKRRGTQRGAGRLPHPQARVRGVWGYLLY